MNIKVAVLIFFSIMLSKQLTFHFGGVTCVAGTKLTAIEGKTPSINGCGSAKYQVSMGKALNPWASKFTSCCNAHDVCYGSCSGSSGAFDKCNSDFKSCLKSKCKK